MNKPFFVVLGNKRESETVFESFFPFSTFQNNLRFEHSLNRQRFLQRNCDLIGWITRKQAS